METNIFIYLVALIGVVFHLAMKYRDSFTKNETFKWKYQLIFTGFSLLTALFLAAFKPSIGEYLPPSINLDNYLLWGLIGYFSDSVWKNVEKGGSEKLNIKTE